MYLSRIWLKRMPSPWRQYHLTRLLRLRDSQSKNPAFTLKRWKKSQKKFHKLFKNMYQNNLSHQIQNPAALEKILKSKSHKRSKNRNPGSRSTRKRGRRTRIILEKVALRSKQPPLRTRSVISRKNDECSYRIILIFDWIILSSAYSHELEDLIDVLPAGVVSRHIGHPLERKLPQLPSPAAAALLQESIHYTIAPTTVQVPALLLHHLPYRIF